MPPGISPHPSRTLFNHTHLTLASSFELRQPTLYDTRRAPSRTRSPTTSRRAAPSAATSGGSRRRRKRGRGSFIAARSAATSSRAGRRPAPRSACSQPASRDAACLAAAPTTTKRRRRAPSHSRWRAGLRRGRRLSCPACVRASRHLCSSARARRPRRARAPHTPRRARRVRGGAGRVQLNFGPSRGRWCSRGPSF